MRVTGRRTRKRYGIFHVSRKGYAWQKVTVRLPFLRDLIVWSRR